MGALAWLAFLNFAGSPAPPFLIILTEPIFIVAPAPRTIMHRAETGTSVQIAAARGWQRIAPARSWELIQRTTSTTVIASVQQSVVQAPRRSMQQTAPMVLSLVDATLAFLPFGTWVQPGWVQTGWIRLEPMFARPRLHTAAVARSMSQMEQIALSEHLVSARSWRVDSPARSWRRLAPSRDWRIPSTIEASMVTAPVREMAVVGSPELVTA